MRKSLAALLFIPFLHSDKIETGTIIATVYTKDKIYLFSDGRTTEFGTDKIISNERNKIFKISDKCALVTAGIRIPYLTDSVTKYLGANKYAPDVALAASKYLKIYWKNMVNYNTYNKTPYPVDKIRIFIFICGYDGSGNQREFFVDNISRDPFIVQEHMIDYTRNNIDFATMGGDNSSVILGRNLSKNGTCDICIRKSFDDTKDEISKTDIGIGGNTFEVIMAKSYFKEIR